MEKEKKNVSRKRFIIWSVGISSLLARPALLKFPVNKNEQSKAVKMLTQDGKLVEIEAANIPSKRKKIKTADIRTWINRRISL